MTGSSLIGSAATTGLRGGVGVGVAMKTGTGPGMSTGPGTGPRTGPGTGPGAGLGTGLGAGLGTGTGMGMGTGIKVSSPTCWKGYNRCTDCSPLPFGGAYCYLLPHQCHCRPKRGGRHKDGSVAGTGCCGITEATLMEL